MPYDRMSDLPPAVKDHLPEHAQEIFLAAFNNAFEEHKSERDAEERAFCIAWGAVKRSYEKTGDRWARKAG